jgi:hypothetical protein
MPGRVLDHLRWKFRGGGEFGDDFGVELVLGDLDAGVEGGFGVAGEDGDFAPAARACAQASSPRKAGRSEGWILMIRRGKASRSGALIMRM